MIIIVQNGQITAVDKTLLKKLNCDLSNISEKISQLDLAVNSLTNNNIQIENNNFNVKEIEILSLENIHIYELKEVQSVESVIPTEIKPIEETLKPIEETLGEIKPVETKTEEKPLEEFSFEVKPVQAEEETTKESSLEDMFSSLTQEIKPIEETPKPAEETLGEIKPVETKTEEKPLEEFSFGVKPLQAEEETTKESSAPATPFKEETLPAYEPEIAIEPEVAELSEPQEISITFEDEFEEIEKILSLNPNEAKKLILEDLQQAATDFEMDIDTIKELYDELISQIKTSKDAFYEAIKAKDYEEMHKISHSLKGASLNLRISNLAIILKTIDEKSKENISFEKLEFLVNNFYEFVEKVKSLEEEAPVPEKESSNETQNETQKEIPGYLKDLILNTIKNYLSTQDEKRLKKDLKYIEKLLNVKINSIEELQQLVKADK